MRIPYISVYVYVYKAAVCLYVSCMCAPIHASLVCLRRYGYVDFPSHASAVSALKYFLEFQEDQENSHEKTGSNQLPYAEEGQKKKKMELCGKPFVLAPSIPMKNHRWILAPMNKVEDGSTDV